MLSWINRKTIEIQFQNITKKDKKSKTTSTRRVVIDSCVSCLARTTLLSFRQVDIIVQRNATNAQSSYYCI